MDKTEIRLELLPIDFDLPLKELAKWHDKWSIWKYGADSIKPERYYNVMPDGSLMGAKEGYELNEEKDNREEVLRLLLKIRLINQKLSGKGLFFHLPSGERGRLKKERERLYNDLKQKAGLLPQSQQDKVFLNGSAKRLFSNAISKGLIDSDGDKYKWNDTASLYGYFVDKTSDFLGIRPSNDRLPWKKYETIITNHSTLLATAKQAVNDYKNKGLPPPEGDDKVNDIC